MSRRLDELNAAYDALQLQYGAKELHSIYHGGCSDRPDVCFVFMNPTGKNVASDPAWKGRRSPWIGTKNVWKLFHRIGLLDADLCQQIQRKRPSDWDEAFADTVYENVEKHRYFITNLGKCTQTDARGLPNSVYLQYRALLCEELRIIRPKKIVTFGNQVSTVLLETPISVSQCRKAAFTKDFGGEIFPVWPVYYPIGNGMMNLEKAVEDLQFILRTDAAIDE